MEFLAGDFVVVAATFVVVVGGASFVDDSAEVCVTFCDREALGVLNVELSNADVVNGGFPDDLLTRGVELIVTVDGVTKSVVDEGVGGAENGFGTRESTTPIGPSFPRSFSAQVNSSGWIE